MLKYWNHRPQTEQTTPPTPIMAPNLSQNTSIMSKFDHYRLGLLSKGDDDDGWSAELHRYLKDMPADITKDTDIVVWCVMFFLYCARNGLSLGLSLYFVIYSHHAQTMTHC
jgi:hypothetical protein